MQHPIEVTAVYKRCISENVNGRVCKRYAFTIIEPHQYQDKEFLLSLFWSAINPSQLIPDKTYLVTVPRNEIGNRMPICGSGYKYKE